MITEIGNITTSDLIHIYSQILTELKGRNVIRTKNLVGDIGEFLVIEYYNKTPELPKLTQASPGTKSIDAISLDGKRYAIKSTSSALTGVIYGLYPPISTETNPQIFDFLIIALFGDNFNLKKIVELTWAQFLNFKRWHSTMAAWNVCVTKDVLKQCKVIFDDLNKTG